MKRRALAALASLLAVGSMVAAGAAEPVAVEALLGSVSTASMAEIIPLYERSHPGTRVVPSFGGAQVLAAQVESGGNVDLILVGEVTIMPLHGAGKVGTPLAIYSFHEAVLVPKGSTKVRGLRDLALPGVRIAIGLPESAIGKYAHSMLEKASAKFGADFERKVLANVVTTKTNSAQIVAAVKSGTADAAIGFSSDGTDAIDALAVPPEDDVVTNNFAAVVAGAPHAAAAQSFIDYLHGSEAQAIFRKHHLGPPR
jgi:molybdate transport system substrate-binding protein